LLSARFLSAPQAFSCTCASSWCRSVARMMRTCAFAAMSVALLALFTARRKSALQAVSCTFASSWCRSIAWMRVVLVPVHRADDAHVRFGCHESHLVGVVVRVVGLLILLGAAAVVARRLSAGRQRVAAHHVRRRSTTAPRCAGLLVVEEVSPGGRPDAAARCRAGTHSHLARERAIRAVQEAARLGGVAQALGRRADVDSAQIDELARRRRPAAARVQLSQDVAREEVAGSAAGLMSSRGGRGRGGGRLARGTSPAP
jgi:hypothetical protein